MSSAFACTLRLKDAYDVVKDPATKSLKGADRDSLKKLQRLVDDAVYIAVMTFLKKECNSFIEDFGKAIGKRQPFERELLGPDSCLLCLGDVGTTGKFAKQVSDHFKIGLTFVSRVNEALEGKLDPKEAQQCVEEWETWSEATVKVYSQVFTSTSCPAKKAFEEEPETIKETFVSVTEEVKELLCGQVNSSAIDAASSCLKFVADNILADPDVELPEKKVTQFCQDVEKSARMSSVMDQEEGESIREGLDILEKLVRSVAVLKSEAVNAKGESDENGEITSKQLEDLGAYYQILENSKPGEMKVALEALSGIISGSSSDKSDKDKDKPPHIKEFDSVIGDFLVCHDESVQEQVGLLRTSFTEEVKAIEIPETLELLPALVEPCTLSHFFEDATITLIKDSFGKDASKPVIEAAVALEEAIRNIQRGATGLKMKPEVFFPEYPHVESTWKKCLLWMSGSKLLQRVGSRESHITIHNTQAHFTLSFSLLHCSLYCTAPVLLVSNCECDWDLA